jgi:hypothetical protein
VATFLIHLFEIFFGPLPINCQKDPTRLLSFKGVIEKSHMLIVEENKISYWSNFANKDSRHTSDACMDNDNLE